MGLIRFLNRPVVLNLIGSLFEKGLPILITTVLTKFMTTQAYGSWSILYTFILISNSFSTSPILAIFARKFFNYLPHEQKLYFYFFNLVLIFQTISIFIYYFFFSPISYSIILEIPSLLLMNLYSYYALYLRFKGQDLIYMLHSFFRLIVFGALVLIVILIFNQVSYDILITIFLISHLPSFIKSFRLVRFLNTDENGDLKEFISLAIYGLSTSLVNGVERFVMVASGYSLSFLGYYSFLYSIAHSPTIFVEALKKTFNPIIYKELSMDGKLSKLTQKFIILIFFGLFIVQFILPEVVYFVLNYFDLINPAFLNDNAYIYLYILSIGFFFQGVYHFLNPYFFYYKKSGLLLLIQIFCMCFYFFIIKYGSFTLDIYDFVWYKTGLLFSITLLLILVKFRINYKND